MRHFWDVWDKLCAASTEAQPTLPAFFRFLTLVGFQIMLAEDVDVAVVEVGLGGRLDATNVNPSPVVCGIASLGMGEPPFTDTLNTLCASRVPDSLPELCRPRQNPRQHYREHRA